MLGTAILALLSLTANPALAAKTAPLVDNSHGKRAHQIAERWVRAGKVPGAKADNLPSPRPVTGLFGVRVTLRLSGRQLGVGDAYRRDVASTIDAPGKPVNLVRLVRQATSKALDSARQSLLDARWRAVRGGANPKSNGKAPDLAEIGDQLLVGVQLGHQLESIQLPRSASVKSLYNHFAPGFHGLRVDGPNQPGASYTWPASALALNASPRSQLIRPLDDEGYPITALKKLARTDGPALQRFEVIHVVRPARDLSPKVLVRGNVLIPGHAIDKQALKHLENRLAAHLGLRFIRNGRVRGTYHPSSGLYDPALASDRQRALAAYALVRSANYRLARNQYNKAAKRHRDQALDLAEKLARLVLRHSDSVQAKASKGKTKPQPAIAGLALLALVDSPIGAERRKLRDRLGQYLLDLRNNEGAFPLKSKVETGKTHPGKALMPKPIPKLPGKRGGEPHGQHNQSSQQEQGLSEPLAALSTAAIASLYQRTRTEALGKATSKALQALWDQAGANLSITALPWFALAHQRSAKLLSKEADQPQRAQIAKRRTGLRKLLERLAEQQVIRQPMLGPNDVDGGFALTPGPVGSPPRPDWRTAHMLLFLSASLRDEKMIRDMETFIWVLTAGRSARFISQLTMDRYASYYAASPEDTVGGVRLTLWDNKLSVAPTAMSLLAVTELRQAAEEIAKRNKPEDEKAKGDQGAKEEQ